MTDDPQNDEANANDFDAQDNDINRAFAAYLKSCDAGEVSSREEFLAQFPELSDQLQDLMQAADLIGRVTLSGLPGSANPPKDAMDLPAGAIPSPNAETQGGGGAQGPVSAGHELHGETIALELDAQDGGSIADPAATLPMANRAKDDPGPTLPFDLGDYQLQQVIGRGGMGVVYLAKQKDLQRMVAVKMIRSGILAGESEVRRFYTEAQAAARLRHPGIVAVHQFGRRAGHHFFSMEYIEGSDLQRRINSGDMSFEQAACYVRDVALAIGHAHGKGVLHRDLKPANVLIGPENRIHVTDFGLAKNAEADSSVTGSGAAVGTPHYMAPEQASGDSDRATPQSDVYSLGAILFSCLTGRPPIVADTVMQTLVKVVHDPAPPVRSLRPDAPVDLETIVAKCLEKQPHQRYMSAKELANDLQAFLDGNPISARPRSRLIKAWHWLEGVPLIGALTGRRKFDTTDHHRRLQSAFLMLILMLPIVTVSIAWWRYHARNTMPGQITISGGLNGGVYTELSNRIANRMIDSTGCEIKVLPSGGSLDNKERLMQGAVDLAPMQASAVDGGNLCVVAPLIHEAVHVIAKSNTNIRSIEDLIGKSVAVGPDKSGSRLAAELVFDSFGYDEEVVHRNVTPWPKLGDPDSPDIAVVCIGRGSALVSKLLESGDWTLVDVPEYIDIALQHPTLKPMTIRPEDYPSVQLPEGGIRTVGTTAFMAARFDTPGPLVTAALHALYEPPELFPGMIRRRQSAEWQGLSFHPVARQFF
ncbi:MAG: serine/threonine-protein kinase, partial [Planctomycetota bacterium]